MWFVHFSYFIAIDNYTAYRIFKKLLLYQYKRLVPIMGISNKQSIEQCKLGIAFVTFYILDF